GTLDFSGVTGNFSNQITGAGALNVGNGSDMSLTGNNNAYTGSIAIAPASRLTAYTLTNIANASFVNNGNLVLNQSLDELFNNPMAGTGVLTKEGVGMIRISSGYAHTGGTNVNRGTLALTNAAAELSGGGQVNVATGATLGGYGKIVGNILNEGDLAAGDAINALAAGAGTLRIQGNLTNHSTVKLAGLTVGNTLNVSGNYSAAGSLIINTILEGDNSVTDKLVVQGSTSGNTDVTVHKQGGGGAQTIAGIEVIEVNGASDGTFKLVNRVVAGAYDYTLVQTGKNWYLQSKRSDKPEVIVIRPEVGAYLANQFAAKDMFGQTLYSRMGDRVFASAGSSGQDHDRSAWVHISGTQTQSRAANQVDQKIWGNNLMLGTDLASNIAENNRWHVGVMGGVGTAHSRNQTDNQPEVANTQLNGYSLGAYGTWFANGSPASEGPYVDTWMQYAWFSNKVSGEGLATQKYDSHAVLASVEAGWTFNAYQKGSDQLKLQPQIQLTYMRYAADNVLEANGTYVENKSDNGVLGRIGLRAFGHLTTVSGIQWQPFAEVNWLHDTSDSRVFMNGQKFESSVPKNRFEVKAGLQMQPTKNWTIWGGVGAQHGSKDFSRLEGTLGVKYEW
ncbi:MAG: autotransporter outer membrane beta-barrel domain-containing protein, partial [Saezia sp.]